MLVFQKFGDCDTDVYIQMANLKEIVGPIYVTFLLLLFFFSSEDSSTARSFGKKNDLPHFKILLLQ